jgi:hypothetical protein
MWSNRWVKLPRKAPANASRPRGPAEDDVGSVLGCDSGDGVRRLAAASVHDELDRDTVGLQLGHLTTTSQPAALIVCSSSWSCSSE